MSKNLKSHMLDNVVTGQIFMAIENIHSKCVEIDNSIKGHKNLKKQQPGNEKGKGAFGDEGDKNSDNDMLSLSVANEKLKYVLHSLQDFREILKKEKTK